MNAAHANGATAETGRRLRPPMARRTKILLAVLLTVLAIPVAALVFVLTYDWNKARPWLNARTSEAIERPFAIRGNLSVTWEQPEIAERERSWRDWIPWPHLAANDVHVGNPVTMNSDDMAVVRQFSFSLNPLALLDKRIAIPTLAFDSPTVELIRNAKGDNNWTFKRQEEPSKWQLELERVVLTRGVVHFHDAVENIRIRADVDTLDNDARYGVGWKLKGSYNGAPVSGGGKAGQVLSLRSQTAPYPVQADMDLGQSRIAVEGTVTRPARLAQLDLRLKLSGASMARLYPFIRVVLPETPAFSTEGRLIGAIDDNSSRWTYDGFKGKVGSSDIGGRLVFQTGKPRPKLSGKVESNKLVFADLAPLIGADSNASKQARGMAPVQPAGKVLPVEEFKTARWKVIDADVRFAAGRIIRDKDLPISKLSAHIIMQDGVLTLDPLSFAAAGGQLTSTIRLDGSSGKSIAARAKVAARGLQLRQLFPAVEKMNASVGEVNADAQLTGTGSSVAALLADANGELKGRIGSGTVSKLLLEQMGLNVGNIILAKLFGDRQVQLNCMASDFDVRDGVMQTQLFVVDTREALLNISGQVNLQRETLNFTLRPESRGLRIFSLRAPLYVRGSFKQPDVSVDKGVLALKAGSAVALGLAAPAAALLPLIATGPNDESNCARLLQLARQKPSAPPPGKTKR
jgi:hypothetical protein